MEKILLFKNKSYFGRAMLFRKVNRKLQKLDITAKNASVSTDLEKHSLVGQTDMDQIKREKMALQKAAEC